MPVADPRPRPGLTADPSDRVDARRRRAARAGRLAVLLALAASLLLPAGVLAEEPPSPTPSVAPATAPPSAEPSPPATPAPSPTPSSSPAPTATPAPDPTPTPAPTPVTITRSVYRSGAGVEQYTGYWCVPASVQTMTNLILGTSDRSYGTQKLLASVTYRFNRYKYRGPGNDIRGWAGALNWRLPDTLPVVYRDRSYPSRTAALDAIVDAIEETGYPVGITVWHGGHARSVVGYRIRQVPGDRSTREILGFYVVGPLGSPKDPWPVRYVTLADFLGDYTRYYEDRQREPWHMDYVLVRPEAATSWARDWPRP